MKRPTILVLGAGYGGLSTVVNLQKLVGTNADIILLTKMITIMNQHGYMKLLQVHYVLTKFVMILKDVIKSDKVKFVKATVEGIDVTAKKLQLMLVNLLMIT